MEQITAILYTRLSQILSLATETTNEEATKEVTKSQDMYSPEILYQKLTENGFDLLKNLLIAVLILVIGKWVARLISNVTSNIMKKSKVDDTLRRFARNLIFSVIMVIVIIAAVGKLGVETASFVAIIGAAGLAIGFALQGSLSNLAAGVMLIVFRPFKADDFVEIASSIGTVKEIQMFNTILDSPDNIRKIIPNSQVIGGTIKNYTANNTRRVDLVVGVSYKADLQKTKEVIESVLNSNELILADPKPTIAVSELANSSVNFVIRPWCEPKNYWNVYFGVTEKVKIALDENNIQIPFPQRDVHIYNEDTNS